MRAKRHKLAIWLYETIIIEVAVKLVSKLRIRYVTDSVQPTAANILVVPTWYHNLLSRRPLLTSSCHW